jgi:hypothetical protein
MRKHSQKTIKLSTNDIERAIKEALVKRGDIIPCTPEEVAFVEKEVVKCIDPIPHVLKDPFAVLERGRRRAAEGKFVKAWSDPPASVEDLARAAREGGKISEDVEERMKRAREQADREVDDGDGDP